MSSTYSDSAIEEIVRETTARLKNELLEAIELSGEPTQACCDQMSFEHGVRWVKGVIESVMK